jgi:hypothetical protein
MRWPGHGAIVSRRYWGGAGAMWNPVGMVVSPLWRRQVRTWSE